MVINVKKCDLALLLAQHKKYGFDILSQPQYQKVPSDDKCFLLGPENFANNAPQRVVQSVSVQFSFNHKPEAKDNLQNIVEPSNVGEIVGLAIAHKVRANFQNKQQISRRYCNERKWRAHQGKRVDSFIWIREKFYKYFLISRCENCLRFPSNKFDKFMINAAVANRL